MNQERGQKEGRHERQERQEGKKRDDRPHDRGRRQTNPRQRHRAVKTRSEEPQEPENTYSCEVKRAHESAESGKTQNSVVT